MHPPFSTHTPLRLQELRCGSAEQNSTGEATSVCLQRAALLLTLKTAFKSTYHLTRAKISSQLDVTHKHNIMVLWHCLSKKGKQMDFSKHSQSSTYTAERRSTDLSLHKRLPVLHVSLVICQLKKAQFQLSLKIRSCLQKLWQIWNLGGTCSSPVSKGTPSQVGKVAQLKHPAGWQKRNMQCQYSTYADCSCRIQLGWGWRKAGRGSFTLHVLNRTITVREQQFPMIPYDCQQGRAFTSHNPVQQAALRCWSWRPRTANHL